MPKERVKIEINLDTAESSVDILNAIGPSCKKDADDWANIIGGKKAVTMKPEFYQKAAEQQKNTQAR